MKLYIANASNQNLVFHYRVIGQTGLKTQEIPAGSQARLAGDFDQREIDSIIKQHERYGMIDYTKVNQARKFTGYCYSIDKPVPPPRFKYAQEARDQTLQREGQEIRKIAAVAAHNQIQETTGGNLKNLEMSVVEDTKGQEGRIAEGVQVPRDGDGANTGGETPKQRANREKKAAAAAEANANGNVAE